MDEVCVFARPNEDCAALRDQACDGKNKACSFYKTEDQYIAARNRAIEINRAKGLCRRCKYQEKSCRLMTKKDALGVLDDV